MMQAYAEGFSIMQAKQEMHLDLGEDREVWRYGSVIRSWLLDLTADALNRNPELEGLEAWVEDSGEGRWTAIEAINLNVSAPGHYGIAAAPNSQPRREQFHRPHAGHHAQ